MKQAWDLWLDQHDGMMGDYEVETVIADEGETPDTGVPAVQRLITEDDVDAMVGLVNSATALGVADAVTEAETPLIIANAGAEALTEDAASPYVWRASFTNAQVAAAMGEYLAAEGIGPVYVMAPDYAAGQEVVEGFTTAYEDGGGTDCRAGAHPVRHHAGLPALPLRDPVLRAPRRPSSSTPGARP